MFIRMKKLNNNNDCMSMNNDFAIIHACKTCHLNGVGYRGSLTSSHPNYLIKEDATHLYLNMVDMEQELLPKFTHPIIQTAMNFIKSNIENRKILIHCNQGFSRSPSIGLLYLAIKNDLPNTDFNLARNEFQNIYPNYQPGRGIALYMQNNWDDLMGFK
jgi:hypothetical protein